MTPSCRRPGCGLPADVLITFDPVGCQVWLDPLDSPDGVGGQPLCEMHAERLHAPRGWVVLDRRSPQSLLLSRSTVAASAPAPRRAAPRRRWGEFSEPTLDFEDPVGATMPAEPVTPVAAEPVSEPVTPVAAEPVSERVTEPVAEPVLSREPDPPTPTEAPADDLGALLEPSGGLLGRAFRSTGHQRSVLTHGASDPRGQSEPSEPAGSNGPPALD